MVTTPSSQVISELPSLVVLDHQNLVVPELFVLSVMATANLYVWATYKSTTPKDVAVITMDPFKAMVCACEFSVLPAILGVSVRAKEAIPSFLILARDHFMVPRLSPDNQF